MVKPVFWIFYRITRLSARVSRWACRKFTAAGLGVLGGVALLGFLAPDTENNTAYQALALLAGFLVLAFVLSWSFRAKFSVRRILPRFATAGVPFSYPVLVRNLGPRAQQGLWLIERVGAPDPRFSDWLVYQLAEERRVRSFRFDRRRRRGNPFRMARVREAPVPSVRGEMETEVRVTLTPLRRGPLRLEGVTLARPDPLGLMRALHPVPLPQALLVLPRRYPLPSFRLPGESKYHQGGVALASNVGQSDEFISLRDYRRGDPPRHIHWRSWARAGKPVVKEFEDEFFVRHALALDTCSPDPQSEVFEEAVSVAASFACTVLTRESLLDLLFVGLQTYRFTAGRGLAQADQMLEVLASARPCAARPFGDFARHVLEHAELASGCICVLLAWDEPRREFVRRLRELSVPLRVLVIVEPGGKAKLQTDPACRHADFFVLECGRIERDLGNFQ